MRAEERPIQRQWKLLSILFTRRYGITVREMAREMKVGEKTIRRDLDLFRAVGIPVEGTPGAHGRKTWRLAGDRHHPPLTFNFEEAAALYLSRALLEPLAGTPFWRAGQSAWGKIRATLSETALRYLDRFEQMFHCTRLGQGDYSGKAEILEGLTFAIEEHRAVHITYQSQRATEPATRDVYPLKLVRHRNALYLIAGLPVPEEIRTYKVDRIEAVEVSAFTHQRYRDFDVRAYLAGSFGIYDGDGELAIAVKFFPPAARYAKESKWHPSQVDTWQRDGSLIVQWRLSSTVEIKSWILSFGASALVLEPAELRAEIAAELDQMLETYRGQPVVVV